MIATSKKATTESEIKFQRVLYIQYLIKLNQEPFKAIIDSENEINAIIEKFNIDLIYLGDLSSI